MLPIPVLALSFADALVLGVLSYVEHSKSRKPSTVLALYLFFSIIVDWLPPWAELASSSESVRVVNWIYAASVAFKVGIFIRELKEKVSYGTVKDEGPSPEETIGVFNRLFYFWLNELLLRGYRTDLKQDDMFPLDRELSSGSLRLRFQTAWERGNTLPRNDS